MNVAAGDDSQMIRTPRPLRPCVAACLLRLTALFPFSRFTAIDLLGKSDLHFVHAQSPGLARLSEWATTMVRYP